MLFNNFKIIFLCLLFLFINTSFAEEIQTNKTKTVEFTQEELNYIKNHPIVKIGMLSNFKPFSYIENQKHQGFTVDLLEKISKISKLKFEIHTDKWSEVLKKFKNKQFDAVSGISYVKKREEFTLFTDSYYEIPTYIFGLKNDTYYKDISDLKNKKVGISFSMYYKDDLINNGIEVLEVKSSNEKAKQLALGNIDYFLASYTSGKKAIVSQSLTSIKPIDEFRGVKKEDLRFGINKENTILHNIMQKSLLTISSIEKNSLTNKWILELKELSAKTVNLTNKEKDYLNEKASINLCIDPNWMPFEKIDKNGKHIGLTKEYIKKFQEKLDIPIKLIKTTTWNQSVEYMENTNCDILSLVMKTENRQKQMNFTKVYINTPLVLATKMNIPFIDNISDLENKKIGLIEGYSYLELLRKKYPNLELVEVKSVEDGLNKVANETIFGFIDTLATIGYELQANFLSELKIGAKFDDKLSLRMGIRKDDLMLVNIFNKLLDSISEKEKKEMLNKHISIKYEKTLDYTLLWKMFPIIVAIFLFLIYRQYLQKKNNTKLKESNKKIQTILDTTMEGIIISKNGIIEDVNQEMLKLFAYKRKGELIGKKLVDIVDESSQALLLEKLKEDFTNPYELQLIKADKSIFYALIRGKTIKIQDGKFRVSSVMDLTDIKEKEALYIQQSKVATAGEMLENISHQWRQPLSQISTISTGIKVQKEFGLFNEDNLINDMENINNSAQYLSQTIEDFKNFLKPNSETSCVFNLKDTIRKLKQLTKDAYEYHNIQIIINAKDCNICQNENLIIQALLNISNNSKDAILENNNTKNETSYVFISLHSDDKNAIITIKDNGGGINENIVNKIFEPYFTTKHEAIGTGIGLYMTYQIIKKQINGNIVVKNTNFQHEGIDYKGACFTIKIPLED